jgi:hypothetical protein
METESVIETLSFFYVNQEIQTCRAVLPDHPEVVHVLEFTNSLLGHSHTEQGRWLLFLTAKCHIVQVQQQCMRPKQKPEHRFSLFTNLD